MGLNQRMTGPPRKKASAELNLSQKNERYRLKL